MNERVHCSPKSCNRARLLASRFNASTGSVKKVVASHLVSIDCRVTTYFIADWLPARRHCGSASSSPIAHTSIRPSNKSNALFIGFESKCLAPDSKTAPSIPVCEVATWVFFFPTRCLNHPHRVIDVPRPRFFSFRLPFRSLVKNLR